MNIIEEVFYNIFWQNLSCRNLFLMAKDELLETITITGQNSSYTYPLNRLVISNIHYDHSDIDTIKYRNENYNLVLDSSIERKVEYFKPILVDFYNKNFKKGVDKLQEDIEKRGWKLLLRLIRILSDDNNQEERIVELLHDYGFVGKHLVSFEQIEQYFSEYFVPGKKNIINAESINSFFEIIRYVKELYVSQSYKKLYISSQNLSNTLHSEDDFESRLKLFRHLYESKIMLSSTEDAFIECSNCAPGVYRGVFQLQMNPIQLQKLTCPVCSSQLTYFIPYKLDDHIYRIIKDKDGLLLHAFSRKLDDYDIEHQLNQTFLKDIEVDCIFTRFENGQKITYLVEAKMYKTNTTINKLKSKIREHYWKLIKDVERLSQLNEFQSSTLQSILLLNVLDRDLIIEIGKELRLTESGALVSYPMILNLDMCDFDD